MINKVDSNNNLRKNSILAGIGTGGVVGSFFKTPIIETLDAFLLSKPENMQKISDKIPDDADKIDLFLKNKLIPKWLKIKETMSRINEKYKDKTYSRQDIIDEYLKMDDNLFKQSKTFTETECKEIIKESLWNLPKKHVNIKNITYELMNNAAIALDNKNKEYYKSLKKYLPKSRALTAVGGALLGFFVSDLIVSEKIQKSKKNKK